VLTHKEFVRVHRSRMNRHRQSTILQISSGTVLCNKQHQQDTFAIQLLPVIQSVERYADKFENYL
jgi:hypothetical protein